MALTLAIPSKGRLQEQAAAYFGDAGLVLKQASGARGYRATASSTYGTTSKFRSYRSCTRVISASVSGG